MEGIKPLPNHVFIEPIEEEKTTQSGIVIPETAEKERPIKGRVVAVGPGELNEEGDRIAMTVKVGDVVLITASRPLSARKRFRLTKIVERAGIRFEEADATADIPQDESEPPASKPVRSKQINTLEKKETGE